MLSIKSHYQTIFQIAPDGMSLSRLEDGLFLDANHSFSEMFGYKHDEIVGKTSYEMNFWHNFADRAQIILPSQPHFQNFRCSGLS